MSIAYPHCFLVCPNFHMIPIPHSIPSGIGSSPQQKAKDARKVNVLCPECGDVSAYSALDVTGGLHVDKPNLFQEGECHLVAIEVGCDGENCEAPKIVHAIWGDEKGTWRPRATQKDWKFSPSARCGDRHQLRPGENALPRWSSLERLPF